MGTKVDLVKDRNEISRRVSMLLDCYRSSEAKIVQAIKSELASLPSSEVNRREELQT